MTHSHPRHMHTNRRPGKCHSTMDPLFVMTTLEKQLNAKTADTYLSSWTCGRYTTRSGMLRSSETEYRRHHRKVGASSTNCAQRQQARPSCWVRQPICTPSLQGGVAPAIAALCPPPWCNICIADFEGATDSMFVGWYQMNEMYLVQWCTRMT
jgi:hypothetical protein